MRTRSWIHFALLTVSFGWFTSSTLLATPFDYPPETFSPGWQTPAPYQRDISWDYLVNPVGGPSPGGVPGALYDGTLDTALKADDAISFGGGMGWNSGLDVAGDQGQVGIDNSAGANAITGTFQKTIKNTATTNPLKHVHMEYTYLRSVGLTASLNAGLPEGFSILSGEEFQKTVENLGNGLERAKYTRDFTFSPNPPEEIFLWTFNVPAGKVLQLEKVHIATECVTPEPCSAALSAFGFGLLLFAGGRRRVPGRE